MDFRSERQELLPPWTHHQPPAQTSVMPKKSRTKLQKMIVQRKTLHQSERSDGVQPDALAETQSLGPWRRSPPDANREHSVGGECRHWLPSPSLSQQSAQSNSLPELRFMLEGDQVDSLRRDSKCAKAPTRPFVSTFRRFPSVGHLIQICESRNEVPDRTWGLKFRSRTLLNFDPTGLNSRHYVNEDEPCRPSRPNVPSSSPRPRDWRTPSSFSHSPSKCPSGTRSSGLGRSDAPSTPPKSSGSQVFPQIIIDGSSSPALSTSAPGLNGHRTQTEALEPWKRSELASALTRHPTTILRGESWDPGAAPRRAPIREEPQDRPRARNDVQRVSRQESWHGDESVVPISSTCSRIDNVENVEEERSGVCSLVYRSSIRIMVRPERSSGQTASGGPARACSAERAVHDMAEKVANKVRKESIGVLHRTIVKEQFRLPGDLMEKMPSATNSPYMVRKSPSKIGVQESPEREIIAQDESTPGKITHQMSVASMVQRFERDTSVDRARTRGASHSNSQEVLKRWVPSPKTTQEIVQSEADAKDDDQNTAPEVKPTAVGSTSRKSGPVAMANNNSSGISAPSPTAGVNSSVIKSKKIPSATTSSGVWGDGGGNKESITSGGAGKASSAKQRSAPASRASSTLSQTKSDSTHPSSTPSARTGASASTPASQTSSSSVVARAKSALKANSDALPVTLKPASVTKTASAAVGGKSGRSLSSSLEKTPSAQSRKASATPPSSVLESTPSASSSTKLKTTSSGSKKIAPSTTAGTSPAKAGTRQARKSSSSMATAGNASGNVGNSPSGGSSSKSTSEKRVQLTSIQSSVTSSKKPAISSIRRASNDASTEKKKVTATSNSASALSKPSSNTPSDQGPRSGGIRTALTKPAEFVQEAKEQGPSKDPTTSPAEPSTTKNGAQLRRVLELGPGVADDDHDANSNSTDNLSTIVNVSSCSSPSSSVSESPLPLPSAEDGGTPSSSLAPLRVTQDREEAAGGSGDSPNVSGDEHEASEDERRDRVERMDRFLAPTQDEEAHHRMLTNLSKVKRSESDGIVVAERPRPDRQVRRCESTDDAGANAAAASGAVADFPKFPQNIKTVSSATIVKGPENATLSIGQSANLSAHYFGNPEPRVSWLKNGSRILPEKSGERIQIKTYSGESTLVVRDLRGDDSGKYEIHIENEVGNDAAMASLGVEGPPEPPAGRPFLSDVDLANSSLTLAWYGSTFDGGSIVTGYLVEMSSWPLAKTHEVTDWTVLTSNCNSTSYIVKGLDKEREYTFRVKAQNVQGPSLPGRVSEPVSFIPKTPTQGAGGEGQSRSGPSERQPNDETEDVDNDPFDAPFEHRSVSLESGSIFKTKYEIYEELGRGRFGVVFKVKDKDTSEYFAAKFVRCRKQEEKQKVRDEIDIMNGLEHPRLLQLAAAYENPKEIIMAMEYIGGGELFEKVVADDFTLTERDCMLFMRQICAAIGYMHAKDIVHLDLKPENILCKSKKSHQIKIIDFGLTRKIKPDEDIRILFGTPEFVSPEVINYEPVTATSDMWSVGVVCYVLLSGLSPFMGDSDVETFTNITSIGYDFDDEAFDPISEDAKDFIRKLLIKNQKKRMSAEECLNHKWLALAEHTSKQNFREINTDKLKSFLMRRRWQKAAHAIRALGRFTSLGFRHDSKDSSSSIISTQSAGF